MRKHAAFRVLPAPGDCIRIVPVHVPEEIGQTLPEAQPLPAPHLTYRGGPLLTVAEVFTVFWGAAWAGAQAGLAADLNAFLGHILGSPLLHQLAEYEVPGKTIGHGRRVGTVTITAPEPHAALTDSGVRHFLQHLLSTNSGLPPPTPSSLFLIYLPPGVTVIAGGGRSCQTFCGYHDAIHGQLFYGVVPFPACAGCRGGLPLLDALTVTSAHELCEAITDPVPGLGWYDDVHGEIGDACAWKTKKVGPYTVQLLWSNTAGKGV